MAKYGLFWNMNRLCYCRNLFCINVSSQMVFSWPLKMCEYHEICLNFHLPVAEG